MQEKEVSTFYAKNRKEWRLWLQKNHAIKDSIWLIYYRKKTSIPTLSWSEAVDEALCFGWIDSTARSIDDTRFMQYFSKRKPNSVWSKINKDKIQVLSKKGLITQAGKKSIEVAKKNGSWNILDDIEKLIIPHDLEKAFINKDKAREFFLSLSKSKRKAILQWLVLAKRTETREKRIIEIVDLSSQHQVPKQFMNR